MREQSDPGLSLRKSSSLSMVTRVVTAVVAGVILKFVEPWVPTRQGMWPHLILTVILILIALYVLWVVVSSIAPGMRERRRKRVFESSAHSSLLIVATQLNEATSPGVGRGLGSILEALTDAKAIDRRCHNQSLHHLATLADFGHWLSHDISERRISMTESTERLLDAYRGYARLCCQLVSAVSSANRQPIHESWDEIREHGNAVGARLAELYQLAQIAGGRTGPPVYVENIPRSK